MNQYKKLPACLSFLPTCLTIILCFLFTGTSAEPAEAKVSGSVNDTAPAMRSDHNKIYGEDEVDVKATFKGGVGALRKFLERNIAVPSTDKVAEGPYHITVDFVVTKEGTLRNFRPLTSSVHQLEDTLISVLKRSPEWIPASVNGKKVDSYASAFFNYDVTGE